MRECPIESSSEVVLSACTTQKTTAEEELRRFSTAVRTSLDGIITGDLNGNITDVNDAVLRMYGCTDKRDLIGKNVLDFVVDTDRERALRDSMESMRTGQGRTTEYMALTKNGEVPIEITTGFIRNEQGEPIGFVDIVHNISERKKAELKLQESEKKYRELADQLPVVVFEIDLDGKFTFVNEKAFEITGYSAEDFENGLNIHQMVVGKELDKLKTRIHETLCGEKIEYSDYNILRKDGTTFPALACANAIVHEGKTVGLRGIVADISEREKTREELIESEEKYKDIFENARDAIYVHDLKGKIISINKVVQEYGYTQEQIIGKNMLKFIPKRYWPKLIAQLSQIARGKRVEGEIEIDTPVGKIGAEYRSNPIFRGDKVVGVHSVMRDITRRKKIEKALLESEQRFKALFTGNPEATAYLAQGFRILDINPRFEELFGYSLLEAKGRNINELIVELTKKKEAETLDQNAIKGYVYHNTVRKRKDGSSIQVSVSAAPMIVNGKTVGYVVMYKDISDLKSAEAAMIEMMQKTVMMNEKLQVVGGLTRHDVRNKLSTITGNIYLNKKRLSDHPEILESLNDMASACEQIVRIFDFAKDYEMLGVEELTYIDVEDAIQKAVSLFSDLKGIKVMNECRGLTVLADSLLRQLFYNLIDNSLKYGRKATKVNVHFEKTPRDELKLLYEDDGVGILDGEKPNLFKEGYTTGKGSGYGLYLIKKMVEVYGWAIQETGEPGRGVQFTITIPNVNQKNKENYQIVSRALKTL